MTYKEFRDKYNGQWLDWDGAYGCQCWDLAQIYFTECLGVPSWVLSGCGNVKNMLWQPKRSDLDAYFDEVDTHAMQEGDVCIWEDNHIAIYDHYDINDNNCYYFSQNPNPSQVMPINMNGHHAFRLRQAQPTPPTPTPEVTPNVERDEYKNQIEVKSGITDLRVRTLPSLEGDIIGKAKEGFYDYLEIVDAEGYNWYKIAESQWIAYNEEWETVYPAKQKDKYIELKVLEEKDGLALVDLGQVYIKQ